MTRPFREPCCFFKKKKKNKANILFWRELVSVPCAMSKLKVVNSIFVDVLFLIRMIYFGFESF